MSTKNNKRYTNWSELTPREKVSVKILDWLKLERKDGAFLATDCLRNRIIKNMVDAVMAGERRVNGWEVIFYPEYLKEDNTNYGPNDENAPIWVFKTYVVKQVWDAI